MLWICDSNVCRYWTCLSTTNPKFYKINSGNPLCFNVNSRMTLQFSIFLSQFGFLKKITIISKTQCPVVTKSLITYLLYQGCRVDTKS